MSVAERAQMMGIGTRTIFKRASAAMAVYLLPHSVSACSALKKPQTRSSTQEQASPHTAQPINNPVPSPKALRSLPHPLHSLTVSSSFHPPVQQRYSVFCCLHLNASALQTVAAAPNKLDIPLPRPQAPRLQPPRRRPNPSRCAAAACS